MANISLRAYNREISNLIDRGQTDEAVAHCEYILQTYPKYIETYRLLGKAYLEGQHHIEALDVFQRVLTVAPDDFITHVGMSIIREEENNLPAAIFHMERAFEVQPSNQAIQDELKHLYGKRDGEEPQKIRLTRGALCRMYARGNQYRQAVAEIKSLLNDSPERVDLEVLLCRMYYNLNMKVEATDLCGKLLNKFPHCLEANRVMMNILIDSGKKSDVSSYKQRIISLDPYEDMVSDQFPSSDQVPEDMVSIEKLVYDPSQKPTQVDNQTTNTIEPEPAPDWVVSDLTGENQDLGEKGFTRILDSSVVSSPDEQLPSPISEQESEEIPQAKFEEVEVESDQPVPVISAEAPIEEDIVDQATDAFSEEISTSTQPVEMEPVSDELPDWLKDTEKPSSATESEIPDWLKESGWAVAGSIGEDSPPSSVIHIEEEHEAADIPIVPAEIPDWVQGLAPVSDENELESEQGASPAEEVLEETSSKLNEWLSGEQKTVDETSSGGTASLHLPEDEDAESGSPEWLKGMDDQSPLEGQAAAFSMEQTSEDQQTYKSPTSTVPQPQQTDKLDMDDAFPTSGGTSILSPDDVPDWLQDLTSTPSTEESSPTATQKLASLEEPTQPSKRPVETPPEIVTTTLPPEDVVPDWLSELPSEPNDKTTATLPESSESLEGEMPSWLSMLDQDSSDETIQAPVSSISTPPAESEAVPSEDVISTEEKPTTSILPPNPEDRADELPEWLKELDGYPEGTSPIADAAQSSNDEFPDWLQSFSDVEPVEQTPITPASLEEAVDEKETEDGSVPDWLSDLDLKGSSVESTVVDVPDWLKGLGPEPSSDEVKEVPSEPVEFEEQENKEVSAEIQQLAPDLEVSAEDLTGASDVGQVDDILGAAAGLSAAQEEMATESIEVGTSVDEITEEVVSANPPAEVVASQDQDQPVQDLTPEISDSSQFEEQLQQTSPEAFAETLSEELESVETEEAVESLTTEEVSEPSMEEMVSSETIQAEGEEIVAETSPESMTAQIQMEVEQDEETAPSSTEIHAELESTSDNEETISEVPEVVPQTQIAEETVVEETPPEPEIFEPSEKFTEEQLTEMEVETPEPDGLLNSAMSSVENGDFDSAQEHFNKLIKAEQQLDKIVEKLTSIVEENPTHFGLWMTLGDALGRSGKLQKALDAYSKAEEYLQ